MKLLGLSGSKEIGHFCFEEAARSGHQGDFSSPQLQLADQKG